MSTAMPPIRARDRENLRSRSSRSWWILGLVASLVVILCGASAAHSRADALTGTTESLWDHQVPTNAQVDPDSQPVELGTYFTAKADGVASGAMFWKTPENIGPHVAHLWDTEGNLLATAAYADETASGWQTTEFVDGPTLEAGHSYVVSYFAP